MIGAIIGDMAGSPHEGARPRRRDLPLFADGARFTDDTVCTIAVAEALLLDATSDRVAGCLRRWVRRYPDAGYGGMFLDWAFTDGAGAYGSWGNGGAMRVGAVPWLAANEADVFALARQSAAVTHDHPDAVTGAQSVAMAAWLARSNVSAGAIRSRLIRDTGWALPSRPEDAADLYPCDVSAAGSVPPALVCALCAEDFESAIRHAVWLGGDTDTIAAMAGVVAEARFGVPPDLAAEARTRLPDPMLTVLDAFERRRATDYRPARS